MNGDQLVELIGRSSDDAGVLACLDSLARGQRPELDPDDPECCFDWIVLNEIGLEIGFDDAAWLLALDESLRRNGPILVSQVWFHVGGPMMQAFPSALPFGLEWSDSAGDARLKLAPYEASRSHYLCDAWSLPACHVSIAYGGESNGLRWIYCQQRERPWPEEGQHRLDLRPEEFVHLFGLRWSSVELREALVQLELEQRLDEVRKDGDGRPTTRARPRTVVPGSAAAGSRGNGLPAVAGLRSRDVLCRARAGLPSMVRRPSVRAELCRFAEPAWSQGRQAARRAP